MSRLLEEEGIYYFWRHSGSRHDLVLVDQSSAHEPYPGHDSLQYGPDARGTARREFASEEELPTPG